VKFTGLPSLRTVSPGAFSGFKGQITIRADVPHLFVIGASSFFNAGGTNSEDPEDPKHQAGGNGTVANGSSSGNSTGISRLPAVGRLSPAPHEKSSRVVLVNLLALSAIEASAFERFDGTARCSPCTMDSAAFELAP
jgi:hypothetical protein